MKRIFILTPWFLSVNKNLDGFTKSINYYEITYLKTQNAKSKTTTQNLIANCRGVASRPIFV